MRPLLVRLATHYLGALHRVLYRLSGGRIGSHIWGLPIVLLTTTGRVSGRRRTVPLCSLRKGESLVVIASYGGLDRAPAWWLNLQREPRATVRIGSATRNVVAREAEGDERAAALGRGDEDRARLSGLRASDRASHPGRGAGARYDGNVSGWFTLVTT